MRIVIVPHEHEHGTPAGKLADAELHFDSSKSTGRKTMAQRKNPAAVALGRKGGQATSRKKAAAARANGKKGGRPPAKRTHSSKGPRVPEPPPQQPRPKK